MVRAVSRSRSRGGSSVKVPRPVVSLLSASREPSKGVPMLSPGVLRSTMNAELPNPRRLLVEAVYETAHNLYHISKAPFDQSQGVFTAWPEFYVFRATELMASRNLAWVFTSGALPAV